VPAALAIPALRGIQPTAFPPAVRGDYPQGAQMSVDPVSGSVPLGRPVPGSYPEAPNPALLAAAIRRMAPPAIPGAVVPARAPTPADGMDPADDAALREVQRLLGNSLSMAGGPAEVAERLRAALVQAQPQLLAGLPGSPQSQRDQLAQALTWLVHNIDQPPALVAGCGALGTALAECGVQPQQLQLVGAALAEAMRAGMTAGAWRQDFDQAWRTTWQHAYEWIRHGSTQGRYQPTAWTATVISHDRRRDDLAVLRLRPLLPMPFRPGQYARIEVTELPGVWRPYSLAGSPRRDDIVELHVRAKTEAGVSGTLVYRTNEGDRLRIARAEGDMGLPLRQDRNLLMIAGDTGVAPLKALLTELADTGDPRSAVLFWGARTLDQLYDIDDVAAIARACKRATVVPVISEGEAGPYASGLVTDAVAAYGEWSQHEVYVAGPPPMLAATTAALHQLGVTPDHIHHDAPEG
jgi:NAD(P)H-flavin reductase/hemoglobin-like flavoprotein